MSTAAINVLNGSLPFRLFVLIMFLGMSAGLVYDAVAGRKIAFFRQERDWRKTMFSSAMQTPSRYRMFTVTKSLVFDVVGAKPLEACGSRRTKWLSHVLLEWGFLVSVIYVAARFFAYPAFKPFAPLSPAQIVLNAGYVMMIAGSAMFAFQRVNVSKDGGSVTGYVAADRFVLGAFAYALSGVLFEAAYLSGDTAATILLLAVYVAATAYLFLTVPWTKFSHMFYKAAYNVQHRLDAEQGLVHTPAQSDKVFIKE